MKIKAIAVSLVLATALLAGCSATKSSDSKTTPTAKTTQSAKSAQSTQKASSTQTTKKTSSTADAVTSASLVDTGDAFVKAVSKNGNWIAGITKDVTISKDIVIEGEFYDKNDTTKAQYRKLALYAQDENKKVTARYTLTAPKLTVKSPNTKIQGGTFKGDVYVEANGFTVQDATINGNVYFAKQEYKDSFVLPTEEGKKGTVTGVTELKK